MLGDRHLVATSVDCSFYMLWAAVALTGGEQLSGHLGLGQQQRMVASTWMGSVRRIQAHICTG